jgi:hypothetical protein
MSNENNQVKDINTILNQIKNNPYDPMLIRRALVKHLEYVTDNSVTQIDSTNPLGFALEAMSVATAAFMSHDSALNRRQYVVAAKTEDELYYHMCDKDYINRFAKPSYANIYFIMQLGEVESAMVYDEELNIHKLVIPRNTSVTIGGAVFTTEYPIEIRKLNHGGLHVIYDTKIKSPIHDLQSNLVENQIKQTFSNNVITDLLILKVPVYQTKITSIEKGVNASVPFDTDISFNDYFYFARVYYQNENSDWIEMEVTHNPYLYNVDKPTAVLKVTNKNLNVKIPQIYAQHGYLNSKIRIDVYETKGRLSMNLGGYTPSENIISFNVIDKERDSNKFTTPITRPLPTFTATSEDITTAGRDPLSFEDLKRRVINNSIGQKVIPISPTQIEDELIDYGFKIVKNVDVVTNRIFYASRSLGKPTNDKLITAAASSIETILTTIDKVIASGKIADNGDSITLLPGTIYESKNGVISIVNDSEIQELLRLPPDQQVFKINQKHYYYTPFHYVLDMADDRFDLRAYYLDNPKIVTKSFIGINDSTLMQVTCDGYDITKTEQGYRLRIITKSSKTFKDLNDDDINVQLFFKPYKEKDYAYISGVLLGKNGDDERIYQFDLETNYNVNQLDKLILTNFKMYDLSKKYLGADLLTDLNIIFSTTADLGSQWKSTKLDDDLGSFMLPKNSKAIICEKFTVHLGDVLDCLWKQARSVISTAEYLKYTDDVIATYDNDVLERDENGSAITIVDGKVKLNYLHKKGDVVYDENSVARIKHKKGDVVLNAVGEPIIQNPRGIARQFDLLMVEAVYWFATDPIAVNYRQEMIDTLLDWMVDGLGELNKRTLEQTKIYFYPRATLGQIDIMYNGGIQTKINAAQSLIVDLVVNKNVFTNLDLRKKIEASTIKVIDSMLENGTISDSGIVSNLKETYGIDVLGIKLKGLGSNENMIAMSVLDESKRCSLKKRLVVQDDNSIMVEEDVSINFIRHDVNDIKK